MMNEKITEAIKSGNTKDLVVYRLIQAELIKNNHSKKPVAEVEVMRKMAKEREKTIEIYSHTDRHDLMEQERYELAIIKTFLPKEPPTEAIHTTIKNRVSTLGHKATMKDAPIVIETVLTKYPNTQKSTIINIFKTFV